jgi:hypothetical protein
MEVASLRVRALHDEYDRAMFELHTSTRILVDVGRRWLDRGVGAPPDTSEWRFGIPIVAQYLHFPASEALTAPVALAFPAPLIRDVVQ